MRRPALLALLTLCGLLELLACAPRYLPVDDQGRTTVPPPPGSLSPRRRADTCGAGALAYLVGKPRSQIPVGVDLTRRRVVCAGCALSGPPDPKRATILFDPQSGDVTEVICR
jgi:hypothetical protein